MQSAIEKLKFEIDLIEWNITSSEEIILENKVSKEEKKELVENVVLLKVRLKAYKKALALLEKHT